jgi:hypothetical protein
MTHKFVVRAPNSPRGWLYLETYCGWHMYTGPKWCRRFSSRSEAKRARARVEVMGFHGAEVIKEMGKTDGK